MSKVAFICPVYDMRNHFDYAVNLYKSKIDLCIQDDFYFVFSDNKQRDKLVRRIKSELNVDCYSLVLPQNLLEYKSKVTVKKLFALQYLMEKYDYIAAIDSETLFIRYGDFADVFEDIWYKRTFLNANVSYDGINILRTCFFTIGLYYNPKLIWEFRWYKYSNWFNEIPVYKCEYLPEFFKWLENFDKDKYLNEWLCFDYYIFTAFLIIEKGFHLKRFKNIKSCGGIMEYLSEFPTKEQKSILTELDTHWSSNPDVTNDKSYLLFHLDRKEENHYGLDKNVQKRMVLVRIKVIIKDIIKILIRRI